MRSISTSVLPPAPGPMTDITPTPAGDQLDALFARHYRPLVRLVSGLLDDNGTCEEVVQDLSLIHI